MTKTRILVGRALFTCVAFVGGAAAANAQQIMTTIQSADHHLQSFPNDTQISSTAGQTLSTTFGGADTRAMTDYGVNKVSATGTAAYSQYATSSWLDSYAVGGTAGSMVAVTFNFAVDGLASFGGSSGTEFNFNVFALRGTGWNISGYNSVHPQWYSPSGQGPYYESPVLTQVVPGVRVTEASMRNFDGFYNYQNVNGSPGSFLAKNSYDRANDSYLQQNSSSGILGGTRYFSYGFQTVDQNGVGGPIIPYSANANAAATRASLVANYTLLASDQLCAGDSCDAGAYPASSLQLTFNVAAGSVFTLGALLYVDYLDEGSVDFFHTAKVSSVTLSPGATLVSQSGTLLINPDGSYGYPAASPGAVPETATWAMMIAGFGMMGAAMRARRRSTKVALA